MKWWNRRRRFRKWNGETLGGGEGSRSVHSRRREYARTGKGVVSVRINRLNQDKEVTVRVWREGTYQFRFWFLLLHSVKWEGKVIKVPAKVPSFFHLLSTVKVLSLWFDLLLSLTFFIHFLLPCNRISSSSSFFSYLTKWWMRIPLPLPFLQTLFRLILLEFSLEKQQLTPEFLLEL